MAQLLYFIPGRGAAPKELLNQIGLGRILAGGHTFGAVDSGPIDGSGGGVLIAASEGPPRKLQIRRGGQKWFAAGPGKAYWLGFDVDAPPGPEDLARPRMRPGEEVRLGDGNLWHVPTARLADGSPQLPLRVGLSADGEETVRIDPEWEGLWDMAVEVWAENMRIVGAKAAAESKTEPPDELTEPMTFAREMEIATAALGVNYRLGRWEVAALELLSSDRTSRIADVLIDMAGVIEIVRGMGAKKNGTPGPDSVTGDT